MAQLSFETAKAIEDSRPQGSPGSNYEFFNLRNDGDEAIVRFLHDSTASFPIFTIHQITVGGKPRKVSCVRDPRAPLHECPLCDSGNKVSNRFFIQMLVYKKNEQGQMVGVPTIWERSMSYATKLKSMLDEYGPLSECLFKVKRNGVAGSQDTTYEMFFCNPKVYSDDVYSPVPEAFKDVKLEGSLIMDKTFEDLQNFLETGSFPATQAAQTRAAAPIQPADEENAITTNSGSEYQPKAQPTAAQTPPWQTTQPAAAPAMNRPSRYY